MFNDGPDQDGTSGTPQMLAEVAEPGEEDPAPIVSFTDPRNSQVYEIYDGCLLVDFQNTPIQTAVGGSYFDTEIAENDPYLQAQTYASPLDDAEIAAFIAAENVAVYAEWPVIKSIAVQLPEGETVSDAVTNWPIQYPNLILRVEPDSMSYANVFPATNPLDDKYTNQWAIRDDTANSDTFPEFDINIRHVWTTNDPMKSFGANTTVVAVLDTGTQWNHQDLQQNSKYYGANVAPKTRSTTISPRASGGGEPWVYAQNKYPDACGHGTAAAGIVSTSINNDTGGDPEGDKDIAGIARYCHYVPISLWYQRGFSESSIRNGVMVIGCMKRVFSPTANLPSVSYIPYYNIEVVNCSIGGPKRNDGTEFLMNGLWPSILFVCPAGNDGLTSPNFPGAYNHCCSVGAYNPLGQIASFSNRHTSVDLVAPGVSIYTTDMKGQNAYGLALGWTDKGYASLQGTSFAAPQVVGVAALVAAGVPSLDASGIKTRIESTAVGLGGPYAWMRRVDAYRALWPSVSNP